MIITKLRPHCTYFFLVSALILVGTFVMLHREIPHGNTRKRTMSIMGVIIVMFLICHIPKVRKFFNSAQYAEARCYPKKRWLGFDFKFKKFSIKQAIFITDIFPSRVKASKQKKLKFFLLFFKDFLRFLLTREKLRNFRV